MSEKRLLVALVPLAKTDLTQDYLSWLQNPEVTQYLETGRMPMTMEKLLDYYERTTNSEHDMIFAIWADGKHVGNITLNGISWIHRTAEVALMIGNKEFWNKGVGTRAIELISEHAFERLNLYKLHAGAYAENMGSIRAFLKAGYHQEAVLKRQYAFTHSVDNVIFERTHRVILARFRD